MVCILNYDEDDESKKIRDSITEVNDVFVIDSSGIRKEGFIPSGEPFYTGNFNKASELLLKSDCTHCLYICSDVAGDFNKLLGSIPEGVGIYVPAIKDHHRINLKPQNIGQRKVRYVDGIILCVHRKIIEACYPFKSKFGWGIDLLKSFKCEQLGMECIVDDFNIMFHEVGSSYNKAAAKKETKLFVESQGKAFQKFVRSTNAILPFHIRFFVKIANFFKGKGYAM